MIDTIVPAPACVVDSHFAGWSNLHAAYRSAEIGRRVKLEISRSQLWTIEGIDRRCSVIDAAHRDVVETEHANSVTWRRNGAADTEVRRGSRETAINRDPLADERAGRSIVIKDRLRGTETDVVVVIEKYVARGKCSLQDRRKVRRCRCRSGIWIRRRECPKLRIPLTVLTVNLDAVITTLIFSVLMAGKVNLRHTLLLPVTIAPGIVAQVTPFQNWTSKPVIPLLKKLSDSVGSTGAHQVSCCVNTPISSMLVTLAKSTSIMSGKTPGVLSRQPPPVVRFKPLRSPSMTAVGSVILEG